MIRTEDLSKMFDDFTAVDGVNLSVEEGQVMVLLGPNGAGKTTTVRMLTSILTPTRGRAEVAGYDVVKEAEKVRSSVGVLTEQHGLYGRMNALEYLEFFARLYSLPKAVYLPRLNNLLEQFGLASDRKKRLGEYSKGMRQKLALVRALLHDPPVLLLDEPTSAMDPESARMVRDVLRTLRSGDRTIILCTHNLLEAEELADLVAIIRKGKIILNDTLENLRRRLLGPLQFEAQITGGVDGANFQLPPGAELVEKGERWLRFQVEDPDTVNPLLLGNLLAGGLKVTTFQPVSRSLEEVYLEAVSRSAREEQYVG